MLILATAYAIAALPGASIAPAYLRCEYAVDPRGVDVPAPRLSWEPAPADPAARGTRQTAWQVRVAGRRDALDAPDLWDSGRIESDQTIHVAYAGRPLATAQQVFWQVRVWDEHGEASRWSDPATWTMGVIAEDGWKGRWIAAEDRPGPSARKGIGYHAAEAESLDQTKWVQVDLGGRRPIDRIILRGVRHHAGASVFGFPARFRVEVADDAAFGSPRLIADHTAADAPPPPEGLASFDAGGDPARYVRVTATKLWPRADGVGCFALAELEVESGGRNAAAGAPVSALDTVRHSGWHEQALTDGARAAEFPTVLVRREFHVPRPVARATAFVCGLGQYELLVDGAKVGDDWITPGWTQYAKTALYDTYDLTPMLAPGRRCVSLILGNGMYHMADDTRGAQQLNSAGLPKAIAQVHVEYADGTGEVFVTDASWKVAPGPATYSGVFGGEDYDARREQPGWDRPGFDDSGWRSALEVVGPGGRLAGLTQAAPPLRLIETRTPVRVTTPRDGIRVFDLGQNAPYVPRITVRAGPGVTVRVWPAEILKPDGTVDQTTMRPGKHISYTLRGGEDEVYWPRFWYVGSRYWQAEALDPGGRPIPVDSVLRRFEGLMVHSAAAPVGAFECSDDLFNRIASLITWAIRSNLASVVSDCPHREKSGWLEQIHLNSPALAYSYDMAALFRKTVEDCADAQQESGMVPTMAPEYFFYEAGFRDSVEWGGAYILVPRLMHRWYGDDTLVGRHFDRMDRYLGYLGTRTKDHILATGLGDWDGYGADKRTPVPVTDTAYYFLLARTMAEFAAALGREDDARRLAGLAAAIRDAFNRSFLDPITGAYATGSQSCQATALDLGLVPDEHRAAAFDRLLEDVAAQNYAVSCGEVGHPSLLRSLADHGRSDLIYRINHQSDRPGYGWQLARGCTTLTEAWDASPISHNHFMLGHILEWFYADLAGIRPDPTSPAFKHFIVRPRPIEPVTWARASYRSIRGPISVSWRRDGATFTLNVTVPPNTTAEVHVPAPSPEAVSEGGRPGAESEGVRFDRMDGGAAVFHVPSGTFRFAAGT